MHVFTWCMRFKINARVSTVQSCGHGMTPYSETHHQHKPHYHRHRYSDNCTGLVNCTRSGRTHWPERKKYSEWITALLYSTFSYYAIARVLYSILWKMSYKTHHSLSQWRLTWHSYKDAAGWQQCIKYFTIEGIIFCWNHRHSVHLCVAIIAW